MGARRRGTHPSLPRELLCLTVLIGGTSTASQMPRGESRTYPADLRKSDIQGECGRRGRTTKVYVGNGSVIAGQPTAVAGTVRRLTIRLIASILLVCRPLKNADRPRWRCQAAAVCQFSGGR